MKVVPVIPSLNPDDELIKLVAELKEYYQDIIIVDDGSQIKDIFDKLKKIDGCIILTHEINRGKGDSLKTAFNYYLDNLSNKYIGVICLDADGQHLPTDAISICKILEEKDKFILGTRLFNTKTTPIRNKIGNRITSRVFKWLYKIYLKDTQTGLRAIPNRLIKTVINVDGSRFEYELNVLIKLVKLKEDIIEHDIKTVYLKNSNKKSHFKVLKDSYKIYKIMFNGRK